jgi:Flp pilus assembly protein TadG
MPWSRIRRYAADRGGASAVEFALVLPVFITLLVGGICGANLAFTVNSLHYAVEEAARCASIKTLVCTNAATTQAYAQSKYMAGGAATFAYAPTGCGHTVTGTTVFPFSIATATVDVPVSAAACFP